MIDADVDPQRQMCLPLPDRWSDQWEGNKKIEAVAAALYALSTPQPWGEAPVMVRPQHPLHRASMEREGRMKKGDLANFTAPHCRQKKRLRFALFNAQGGLCFYCKIPMVQPTWPPSSLMVTIDEKVARAIGGERNGKNCVAACYTCNTAKMAMTVEEFLASDKFQTILKWNEERLRHARNRSVSRAG